MIVRFRPSAEKPDEERIFPPSWTDAVYHYFGEWVRYVENLLTVRDPWQTVNELPAPELRVDPSTENTLLSVLEYEQVTMGLLEIKKLFLEQTKDISSQTVEVSVKIDKLIEDGKSLGRKDWFNHIVAIIASIVVSCSLTQDVTKQAWQILKASVNGVITLAQTPAAKAIKDIVK